MMYNRWQEPTRLPKMALLFQGARLLRQLWPLILLLGARALLNDGSSGGKTRATTTTWFVFGGIAFFLVLQINELLRWVFFRYQLIDGEFIVQSGWLSRKRTVIPLARIQAVHQHQNVLHRITQTCKLHIDTAGSQEEELSIEGLSLSDAAALRAILHPAAPVASASPHDPVEVEALSIQPPVAVPSETAPSVSMRLVDLLRLSATENHLQTLLLVLLFLFGKMQDMKDYLGIDTMEWMVEQSDSVRLGMQAVAMLALFGLGVTLLVSLIRVVLRYGGFNVQFQPDALQMKWGLLETRRKLVPRERIQQVTWKSNWLRQRLQLYVMRVHILAESEGKEDMLLRMPISGKTGWKRVLDYYKDVSGQQIGATHQPDLRWWIRRTWVFAFSVLVVLVATLGMWAPLWTISFPIVLWLYFAGSWWVWRKRFRGELFADAYLLHRGVWGYNGSLVRLAHVQSVSLHQSPYMRAHQLATVKMQVAGGNAVVIPYLRESEAVAFVDYVAGYLVAQQLEVS
jgi:putative membrane protein